VIAMTQVVEVLQKARALIEKPEDWSPAGWSNDARTTRCAARAISHAHGVDEYSGGDAQAFFQKVIGCYAGDFNDTHTHAEVLAAFDKAIEMAKSSTLSETEGKS
jgi:hypothetical protein